MGYFYDGGNPPNEEKTITTSEGIQVGVPAKEKDTVFVEGITRDQLWETINENTELKQENYMLKAQLEQIRRILRSE